MSCRCLGCVATLASLTGSRVLDRTLAAHLRATLSTRRRMQSLACPMAVQVEASDVDFSVSAMTASTSTESPAGARQRDEYSKKPRAPRQPCKAIRYAQRSQVSR